ncbi:hypothetical protein V2J09_004582 [Rumex salicifolius]
MARSLSQALNKTTRAAASNNPRLLSARQRSTFPEPPVIYHGYKDPDAGDGGQAKKEDAVHHIIVKRSQPNWLPLRPGFSYWAPPKSNSGGSIPDDHFMRGEAGSTSSEQNAARSDGDQEN